MYYYHDKEGPSHGPVDAQELAERIKEGKVDELTIRKPGKDEPGGRSVPSLELHLIPAVANMFFPGIGLVLQRRYPAGIVVMFGLVIGAVLALVAVAGVGPGPNGERFLLVAFPLLWNGMLWIASTISIMEYRGDTPAKQADFSRSREPSWGKQYSNASKIE